VTGPGIYELPVRISLPAGFTLIRKEPESLTLVVTMEDDDEDGDYPTEYDDAAPLDGEPEGGGEP